MTSKEQDLSKLSIDFVTRDNLWLYRFAAVFAGDESFISSIVILGSDQFLFWKKK